MSAGTLLRIWLAGGVGIVALLAIYEFAPILLPIFVIAAGLAGMTFLIVRVARALERRRDSGPHSRGDL